MKKLFLVLAAAFAMVACQTDINEVGVVAGGEVDVTFEVGTPTRAYSDGKTATRLQYAIYDETGAELTALTKTDATIDITATVELKLVTGNSYTAIFWADNDNAPYEVDFEHKTMTVDYTGVACNNEDLDAFYAKHEFTVKGAQTETIELRRPFAQLNIGTSDYLASANAGYTPNQSYVKVTNIYNTLDFWSGAVSGETAVEFAYADIKKDETFPVGGYEYLAMNYLLVNGKETVDVEFAYKETSTGDAKTRIVGSVPVQRNYRTNIYGQLLTSDVDINVVIKPEYEEPAYNIEQLLADQLAQGGYIKLTDNIVLNNNVTGFVITADTEIDLDGKTITIPDTDATRSASSAKASIFTIEGDANFTIKNGTIVIPSTNGNLNGTNASTGAGNAIKFDSTGKLVVENVTIEASKRGGWRAIEVYAGEAEINNSTINCYHGSGVNSSNAKVTLNNCDITVNGMYSAPYNSVCFSCMYGGELTVNGGNYKMINTADYATGNTHGGWLGIVMSSGGTLILNDGTFENVPADGFNPAYERAIIEAENNAPAVSTVIFAGGKYKPQGSKIYSGYGDKYYPTWVNTEKLTLGEDGWYTIADNKGYVVNGDEYLVSTGAGLAAAVVDAPANAKITLTANVDLTDVVYTPREFTTLVFNGNNHTISGVKVEGKTQAALFKDTNKFEIKDVTVANSTFVAQNVDGEDSAAAFVGFDEIHSAYTCKLENCHVVNSTIGSAKYVGGLVAYKNGGHIELTNCSVEGCTLVSKYTEDGGAKYKGHCGGLIGLTDAITISNCVVENNTFDVLGARGGLFIGSAQHNSAVSGIVAGNTGLDKLCGEVNNIKDWNNVKVQIAEGLYKTGLVYSVTKAEGLVALSSMTIKANESVVLEADIDLAGVEFNGLNAHNPENNNTFDGQGHIVSNWTNEAGKSDLGFIATWVGAVKNVTIKNAKLKTSGRSAIVAGKIYGNIENCHVVESSIVDSYWACGIIAGLYNNGSISGCSVTDSSVKSNGGVGGIVGVINESSGKRGVYNCTVANTTVHNTGVYGESYSAALVCGKINISGSTVEFKGNTLENNTKEGQYVGDLYYNANGNTVVVE